MFTGNFSFAPYGVRLPVAATVFAVTLKVSDFFDTLLTFSRTIFLLRQQFQCKFLYSNVNISTMNPNKSQKLYQAI